MGFNVLTEPWIPVRGKNGGITNVNLADCILRANEYIEISDTNPQYEYGIYRFLFAFLMDMYRPEDSFDLEEIMDKGSFDYALLNTYVEACKEEGVSFDLFDAKRPFMQSIPSKEDSKEYKSIAYINPALPSGNNHVHFDHTFQQTAEVSVLDALKSIIAMTAFSTSASQGYPSTVNGAPPIYVIVRGNSLFETLVYGMIPLSLKENVDDPPVFWRWNESIIPKKQISATSFLFGLTFPCRKVRLGIPDQKGMIHECLYEQGMNFMGYDGWEDPYVTYLYSDKGRSSMKPKQNVEVWRNIDVLMDRHKNAALVVKRYLEVFPEKEAHLIAYSIATNTASYLDAYRGEYRIPVKILDDDNRMSVLKEGISIVENGKSDINSLMNILLKTKPHFSLSIREVVVKKYYNECRNAFFTELWRDIESLGKEQLDICLENWRVKTTKRVLKAFDEFVKRNGNDAKIILAAELVKSEYMKKVKKGGLRHE